MLSCDSLLPGLELIICLLPTASSYELCLVVVCGGCFYFWILFCFCFVCVCFFSPHFVSISKVYHDQRSHEGKASVFLT